MYLLYNIVIHCAAFLLRLLSLFSPKLKLFVQGRLDIYPRLAKGITTADAVIWIHTASLGEYEQGLPLIEKIKTTYPKHKIVITFFSPSGYEVKQNDPIADAIVYLPVDTLSNAKKFIATLNPKLAIFVKYEIWPNHLKVLKESNIPTLLISAYFKKEHSFFKWYGGFMRKSLGAFTHFFVQDPNSKILLERIGYPNVTVSGDTRFDRVSEILERDNRLQFMAAFKQNKRCLVAGSTWPEGEALLVDYLNNSDATLKYVIAPHNIIPDKIESLKNSIDKSVILYSEIGTQDISNYDVLLIDTIGLLTKIYSYADIAYVGGGFTKGGLHNTLEPAVFGIPVVIGPIYKGFKEAEDLVSAKGVLTITTKEEFTHTVNELLSNANFYDTTAAINKEYVIKSKGASVQITTYIRTLL